MKENILYAYHMEANSLKNFHDYSRFQFQEKTFYFTKLKRDQKGFQELLQVMQELIQKDIPILTFILNVQGSYITMVGEDAYVLMEAQEENVEYGLLDILDFQKKLVLNHRHSSLYRNEWANLWSQKVDYFEYQIHELGKDHPILLNSFSYYVGLAENAICYARNVQNSFPNIEQPVVLSHRRVIYPNVRLNFYNPLNLIFDLEVRDIGEYLKSMFFQEHEGALIDLKAYIDLKKPDAYSSSMLFARLLYPSYYFDLHERIMEADEKEEKLLSIIDQVEAYELFLKKAWQLLNAHCAIEPLAWILKEES